MVKDDIVMFNEISYDAYKDLNEMFGDKNIISNVRKNYKGNCVDAAWFIKKSLNQNRILAEVITFKNGNAFLDGGICVFGNRYSHHSVVLLGDGIIDILHTDKILQTKEYIEELEKNNPKLHIYHILSTGWYTDDGYLYRPSINDLKCYEY